MVSLLESVNQEIFTLADGSQRLTLVMPDIQSIQMLARRLAAIFYDVLLLIGVMFFASLPVTVASGEAIHSGSVGFQLYLLAIIYVYLAWQWTHGGQTLGMKAWRLRLVTSAGNAVDWPDTLRRFFAALLSVASLGLGYLWLLFDKDRLSWHDRLSGTRMDLISYGG